jgi:recombination protein RecA
MAERKTLSEVLKDIKKEYGTDVVLDMNNSETGKVEALSTGCYSLDSVFGCGGMPKGRIIDVYGAPSSGKSTLAMFLAGNVQRNGGKTAWLDAEFCFASNYATKVGINTKDLLLFQPESAEQAIDITLKLVESGEVSLIVIDSTAALVPETELEGEIRDSQVALQARILSKGLRMITGIASKSKTTIIFISQVRDKIGYFVGPTTDSTGGKALKFYSSVRLKVDKVKSHKDSKDVVVGNRLKIEASKNKVGLPFRSCEIDLYFEKGIDVVGDIFDVAVANGIISKEGNTYSYAGNKLAVGRDSSTEQLKADEKIYSLIKEQVMLIGKDKDDKEIKQIKNKK